MPEFVTETLFTSTVNNLNAAISELRKSLADSNAMVSGLSKTIQAMQSSAAKIEPKSDAEIVQASSAAYDAEQQKVKDGNGKSRLENGEAENFDVNDMSNEVNRIDGELTALTSSVQDVNEQTEENARQIDDWITNGIDSTLISISDPDFNSL